DHDPEHPGEHPDGLDLPRDRRAGRVRVHARAEQLRRPRQLDPRDAAVPVPAGVQPEPVRVRQRGRRSDGRGDPGLRGPGVHDQPPHRRKHEEQLMAGSNMVEDRVEPRAGRAGRGSTGPGSGGDRAVTVTSHVVLGIWSLVVVLPLLWVFLSAFNSNREIISGSPLALPRSWSVYNFVLAWVDEKLGQAMLNSVIVVGCALALVMLLGAMCAYVLARFEFFGRRAIYYLMLAGLTFPVFLAIVPLFFVLQTMGVLNTLHGLILTYVAFALPFTVFFLYAFFQGLPGEISEAAAIDGAGKWRTFFQVMLPMATS